MTLPTADGHAKSTIRAQRSRAAIECPQRIDGSVPLDRPLPQSLTLDDCRSQSTIIRLPRVLIDVVLASSSPRRANCSTAAGIAFEAVAVDVDESVLTARAAGRARAAAGARKGDAVARRFVRPPWSSAPTPSSLVGSEILGKPTDEDDATRMLRAACPDASTRC